MEQSKQRSAEVIELGKKIVYELGMENSVDTLSRWMAHYLAELLYKLEASNSKESKKEIEQECIEVILKLWKNKKSLPISIDPLEKLSDAIGVLQKLNNSTDPYGDLWYIRDSGNIGPYSAFAKNVDRSAYQIIQLSLMFSIANEQFSSTKKWNEELGETLTDEESKLIDLLEFYFSKMEHIVFTNEESISIMDLSPTKRKKAFFDKLTSLIDQQHKALTILKESIKHEE